MNTITDQIALRSYKSSLLKAIKTETDPEIIDDAKENMTWVSKLLSTSTHETKEPYDERTDPLLIVLDKVISGINDRKYPYPWTTKKIDAYTQPPVTKTTKTCLIIQPTHIMNYVYEAGIELPKPNKLKSRQALKKLLYEKGMVLKSSVHPYINQKRVTNCIAIRLDKLAEHNLFLAGYGNINPQP